VTNNRDVYKSAVNKTKNFACAAILLGIVCLTAFAVVMYIEVTYIMNLVNKLEEEFERVKEIFTEEDI